MITYLEDTLTPLKNTGNIRLYGPDGFAGMRRAGRLVAECLDELADRVRPGITTQSIDDFVFQFAMDHGALPATLNYRGYTKSSCISINHVICHGIPSPDVVLVDGDIVNIDVTVIVDGWHGDSSRMYGVGEVKPPAQRLVEITYESLLRGIEAVRPGATTADIGAAIQTYVEARHLHVVRDFCGHGIGRLFHDAPNILHYGPTYKTEEMRRNAISRGETVELRPGMIFTIEPMVNQGNHKVKVLKDGWTAETSGKFAVSNKRFLSAQFEHAVGVTETGVEVFTLSPRDIFFRPFGA